MTMTRESTITNNGREITPDQEHLSLLKSVSFRPVFIMGDHRSGTTLLYQLLGDTGCFNVVTAYHIICYDQILANHLNGRENEARAQLQAQFSQMGLTDRVIDSVQVTPDLPEEYGFRLERKPEPRPKLRPGNLENFVELCCKVQFTGIGDRYLLLKNPWDFLNFMYVKSAFPMAKFIIMHRHPTLVINSQLRSVRSSLTKKNEYIAMLDQWYDQLYQKPLLLALNRALFSSRFDLGLRVTARHVKRASSYFLRHVDALPPEDYITVKYEDLCNDAEKQVTRILDFLSVSSPNTMALAERVRLRQAALEPEVKRSVQELYRSLQQYFDYCDYMVSP